MMDTAPTIDATEYDAQGQPRHWLGYTVSVKMPDGTITPHAVRMPGDVAESAKGARYLAAGFALACGAESWWIIDEGGRVVG